MANRRGRIFENRKLLNLLNSCVSTLMVSWVLYSNFDEKERNGGAFCSVGWWKELAL